MKPESAASSAGKKSSSSKPKKSLLKKLEKASTDPAGGPSKFVFEPTKPAFEPSTTFEPTKSESESRTQSEAKSESESKKSKKKKSKSKSKSNEGDEDEVSDEEHKLESAKESKQSTEPKQIKPPKLPKLRGMVPFKNLKEEAPTVNWDTTPISTESIASKTVSEMLQPTGPPSTPSLFQLEEVEHLMANLAQNFTDLLKTTRFIKETNFEEMLASSDSSAAVKALLLRPRVQLGQKIVQQYWDGHLPLINDIIYSKICQTGQFETDAQGFAMSNAERQSINQSWANRAASQNSFQHGANSTGVSTTPTGTGKDSTTGSKRSRDEAMQGDFDSSGSNEAELVGEPDEPADGTWPPPLPEITNAVTFEQVFTHRSWIKDTALLTPAEVVSRHNERLEFKGDSVLDFIICDMLFDRFPTANEGVLTLHKSALVCNETLAEFSAMYDLPSKLKTQLSEELKIKGGKKSKLVADIFEAYIGGLTINRGFAVVQKWLLRLYEPLVRDLAKPGNMAVDKSAKSELYRKIGSSVQRVTYVASKSAPYKVKCMIGDEVIGQGVDHNIKDAGLRAAMHALTRTDVIEKYAKIRRDTPRTAPVTGSMAT